MVMVCFNVIILMSLKGTLKVAAWAVEMTQMLIAPTAPLEDQVSIPSTHMAAHNCVYLQFQDLAPPAGLHGYCTHVVHKHTCE